LGGLPGTELREGSPARSTGEESRTAGLSFTMPWPPSVNSCWKPVGRGKSSRMMLTPGVKAYRQLAWYMLVQQRVPRGRLAQPVAISIVAHPPNARTHDIDNLLKVSLDALTMAGVLEDDKWIEELSIRRGVVRVGGALEVELFTTGAAASEQLTLIREGA